MEFPREEYWSGLPFPSPGDLPSPGIEPGSPALVIKWQNQDSILSLSDKKPLTITTVLLGAVSMALNFQG